MVEYNALLRLPSSDELPDADDTPVDNELQDLIPDFALCHIVNHLVRSPGLDFGVRSGHLL
ncbi:hypothetical protein [Thalassoporum mexicanum]|uniref:hypothetical protein n=1 Tax=Thalassoporum mexicanum TaxID=3457544 RepID=UPI0002F92096|nr:hypothetical protein [Pseudanabaena sp. PCC 7367]